MNRDGPTVHTACTHAKLGPAEGRGEGHVKPAAAADAGPAAGTNCIKIVLPGKSILGDYFQDFPKTFSPTENQFSRKTYFYTIGP